MGQPYFNRGVPLLRLDPNSGVEQQWMIGYNFARTLGFNQERSAWVSNQLTPAAIDFSLANDFPTRWELMNRELNVSPVMLPIPALHFKLEVNQPNDAAEQEANAVAEKVVSGETAASTNTFFKPAAKPVQRAAATTVSTPDVTRQVTEVLQQPGQPLPDEVQAQMSESFGHDFSHVRVHTGTQAAEASSRLQAKAFTAGNDIVFAEGQYQPQSQEGRKLLAHELTHVVQQQAANGTAIIQRFPMDLTPLTIEASGFQSAALTLSQAINEEAVRNNARIMVAIGTNLHIFDGAANQLTSGRPVRLTQRIDMPNGVYTSRGQPPVFFRVFSDENGNPAIMRSVYNRETPGGENIMLESLVRESDRTYLHDNLSGIDSWFLVLPGGAAGAGGRRTTPQWATNRVSRVLRSLRERRGSGTGTGTGTNTGSTPPTTPVPERQVPDRVVPWVNESGVYANVWAHGTHTTLTLRENETQEQLEQRIRNATEALRNATDPEQSTRIANGATETGFTEPVPGSRPQNEQPGSGRVTNTEQQRERIAGANASANWPAYSARILNYGADISVLGANNRMAMEIDYSIAGSDLLSQVAARMQHINYYWEIFDVTHVPTPQREAAVAQQAGGSGLEVGPGSGPAAELYRNMHAVYEDQVADLQEMAGAGIATNMALWNYRVAQLSLMAVSTSVRTIGNLISSYVSIVTAPLNERNFGWNYEGEFLIRCIATPVYHEGDPNRRASSVATKVIKVMEMNSRAEQEVTREEQELAQLRRQLAQVPEGPRREQLLAQIAGRERIRSQTTMENVDEQLRSARQQLGYAEEIVRWRETGTSPQRMSEGARLLRVQLELNGIRAEEFRDHIRQQVEALERMQRFGNQMMRGLKPPIYRPRVVLASEENGQVSALVMMLAETTNSSEARKRYCLVDLTSPGTQDSYEGVSTRAGTAGHAEAVQNAFYHFRDNSEYGRGTLAIRLPEAMTERGITVEQSMRSRPGSTRRWMQRLQDLATAAEIAGLVLTGPAGMAVGMIGGVAGAAVAVDSLVRRRHAGRFTWNFQTVMEITGVIGGVVPFMGLSRRLERTVYYIGIAQLGQSALAIPIQLEEQLRSIEMDMSLPEGERRARRAEAFLQAVRSGAVLMVSAEQMAAHGAPEQHTEPQLADEPQQRAHHGTETPAHRQPEATVPDVDPAVVEHPDLHPGGRPPHETPAGPHEPQGEAPARPSGEHDPNQPEPEEHEGAGGVHVPLPTPPRRPGAAQLLRARIREILRGATLSEHANETVRTRERQAQMQRLLDNNPDLATLAQETLLETGSFRRLREMVAESFFGETPEAKQMAQQALQRARKQMADEALQSAIDHVRSLYPELQSNLVDMGTPGFGSDRDVTIQFQGGGEGAVNQRIDASLQAVRRAYDALRSRGIEPDSVLDTNFYTELHEPSIRPQNPREAAQILFDQSVVSMAEMRMGMTAEQWAAYREAQLSRLRGQAEPGSTQARMEGEARARVEAELNAAEALATRLRPEGQTAGERDALLTRKREELSNALRRNAPAREIRQLMAEIKLLEPEAYGTRAAVESVVGRQQTWARGGPESYMQGRQLPAGRVERLAFLAQDATSNAGLLFGHSRPSGNSLSGARSVAKYLGRVAHAVFVDGHLPIGAAREFTGNIRRILDTKNLPPEQQNAAILHELVYGLLQAGHSQESLASMSDEQIADLWVNQARRHATDMVAQIRTAEQMAHAQEGGPDPLEPPPAPAGGGIPPPAPPDGENDTPDGPGTPSPQTSPPQTGGPATPPPGAPPNPPGAVQVYVTGAVEGRPSSGIVHVVRNGQEETFSRTNRTLAENMERGFLREERGLRLSVEEMRGKRVLDVAAGTEGMTVQQLRERGIDAYGMDIALSSQPLRAPSAETQADTSRPVSDYLRQGDLAAGVPFSGQFDVIYELFGGIAYGLAQSHPEAVTNLLQRLAPGGMLYLAPLDLQQQNVLRGIIPAAGFRIETAPFHGEDQIWRIYRD